MSAVLHSSIYVHTGPDGTIIPGGPASSSVPAAAAAAASLGDMGPAVMGLFSHSAPEPVLDPHTGMADDDYLQTTTITEVPPSLTPGLPAGAGPRSSSAAAAAGGPIVVQQQQQRVPMAAGTMVFGPGGSSSSGGGGGVSLSVQPAPAIKGSPTAVQAAAAAANMAAAAAGAAGTGAAPRSSAGGGGSVLEQQPRVDSPPEPFDMGMQDLLANLSTVNSSELMLTDDVKQDDIWDMLFGRSNSGALGQGVVDAAAAAAAAGGVGGSSSSAPMAVPHAVDAEAPIAMSIGSPSLHGGVRQS